MSMDWGPPNYIPEWQDLDRTRTYQADHIAYDIVLEPAPSWSFLRSTGFKVLAVLGMTWVAFVCSEAYRSSLHKHPAHVVHGHTQRKDVHR